MEREQIVSVVRDWLDANDWNYEYDAEYHYITSGITCGGKFLGEQLDPIGLRMLFSAPAQLEMG